MTRIITILNSMLIVSVLLVAASCSDEGPTEPTPTKELTVALSPAEIFLGAGSSATVNVTISEAKDVVSWRAVLSYDPAKLNISSLKIRELSSNFLANGGASIIESDRFVDEDNGKIIIGALAQKSGFAGEDGDGILAQFKISSPTADPASAITIESIELYTYPVANPPVGVTPKVISATIKKGS